MKIYIVQIINLLSVVVFISEVVLIILKICQNGQAKIKYSSSLGQYTTDTWSNLFNSDDY